MKVPEWLKNLYDWAKILGLISAAAALPAGWLLGAERGVIVGVVVPAAFLALFATSFLVAGVRGKIADAIRILEASDYTKAEEKKRVASDLKESSKCINILVAILAAVVVLSLGIAFTSPLYHFFWTATPTSIRFAELRYHQASREAALFKRAPFLRAVITSLEEEGGGSGKPFRIVLGTTKPFKHPTPPFTCTLEVDGGKYLVNGYAFRLHSTADRTLYEPVPVTLPAAHSVVFAIPASEDGDVLLVVARITAPDTPEFPADLTAVSSLRLVPPKE